MSTQILYLLVNQFYGATNIYVNEVDISLFVNQLCTFSHHISTVTTDLEQSKYEEYPIKVRNCK